MGVQTGNLCEECDASATVLLGEKADEEASSAFVGGSDQTVDPPVLLSQSAVGVFLAGRAGAYRDDTWRMLLRHGPYLPGAICEGATVILPKDQ
jgi:hypothetical protein